MLIPAVSSLLAEDHSAQFGDYHITVASIFLLVLFLNRLIRMVNDFLRIDENNVF